MKYKKILILIIILFTIIILRNKNNSCTKYTYKNYIVESGDTAWEIMNENNSANKDIRELIYYIEKDNNIQAGHLNVGQEIKIRIYENN